MIELARVDGCWTVTLNRPDKANALTLEMLGQLDEIFASAQQERDLRALVVTGAGDRVFCAGADLGEARDATGITANPIWESVSGRLANLPCLTIAALNGTLAGGGFGVALACDLRIAVPTARFFYPVLKNGFLPQPSDVQRMKSLIGPSRTKLILIGGQKTDAVEALSIGLIDRIVPAGEMDEVLHDLTKAARTAKESVLVGIKRLAGNEVSRETRDDCYRAVYAGDESALDRLRGLNS